MTAFHSGSHTHHFKVSILGRKALTAGSTSISAWTTDACRPSEAPKGGPSPVFGHVPHGSRDAEKHRGRPQGLPDSTGLPDPEAAIDVQCSCFKSHSPYQARAPGTRKGSFASRRLHGRFALRSHVLRPLRPHVRTPHHPHIRGLQPEDAIRRGPGLAGGSNPSRTLPGLHAPQGRALHANVRAASFPRLPRGRRSGIPRPVVHPPAQGGPSTVFAPRSSPRPLHFQGTVRRLTRRWIGLDPLALPLPVETPG
jgi:hypothetical protein